MGIDHGVRKIGIAISDPLKIISYPYKTIDIKNTPNYISELKKIIAEKKIESIVVGYPITLLGNYSKQTEITEKFINEIISDLGLPVYKCDERLSSAEAKRYLKEQNIKTGHNKEKIDQMSASIILRQFLSTYQK
jgi:putative Holliday junction resolvase